VKKQKLDLQTLFDLFFVGLGIWTIYWTSHGFVGI